jgi:hypothetical protein
MSTNYIVSGHGDLSTIFKSLTTHTSLTYDTSYSVAGPTGAVDLRNIFRPSISDPDSKILYNTNYFVNGTDLKDIFMDISYNPFIVTASGEFTGTNPIIFTGAGSFIVTFDSPVDISYAVVGGGGGGGGGGAGWNQGIDANYSGSGGGGGGGGLSYFQFTPTSGQTYVVNVGAAGPHGAAGYSSDPQTTAEPGYSGNSGGTSEIVGITGASASGGGGGAAGQANGTQSGGGGGGVGTAGSQTGGGGGGGSYGHLAGSSTGYSGGGGNNAGTSGTGQVTYGSSQTLNWGGGGGGGSTKDDASVANGGLQGGGNGSSAGGSSGQLSATSGSRYGAGGGGGGGSMNAAVGFGGADGAKGVVIIWWTKPTRAPAPLVLETIPGKPTINSVNPGNSQISLTWTAPTDTGGSPITHYMITYATNSSWTTSRGIKQIGTSTSTTITGLTNGETYYFRVYSINIFGTSTTYDSSGGFIPVTNPSVPRNFIATPGNGEALLSWSPPADNGGFPIINYVITYTDDVIGLTQRRYPSATDVSFNITALTNGKSYTFNIIAKNSRGLSSTDASVQATPMTTPTAPTNVVTTAGNGQVLVAWSAPLDNGGSTIINYIVEYKNDTELTWHTTDPIAPQIPSYGANISVTGLINGQTYYFKVAAINSMGTGLYSINGPTTPFIPSKPSAPTITNVSGDITNSHLVLTWTPPANTGGTITGYTLSNTNLSGEGFRYLSGNSVSPLSISSIYYPINTSNTFKLCAINASGSSLYSDPFAYNP